MHTNDHTEGLDSGGGGGVPVVLKRLIAVSGYRPVNSLSSQFNMLSDSSSALPQTTRSQREVPNCMFLRSRIGRRAEAVLKPPADKLSSCKHKHSRARFSCPSSCR